MDLKYSISFGVTVALAVLSRCAIGVSGNGEVHLEFVAPPAGNCTGKAQEECISTVGDFSAGIRAAISLAERHINRTRSYLHRRSLKIDFIEPESVR